METFKAKSRAGNCSVEAILHVPSDDAYWHILEVKSNAKAPETHFVFHSGPKLSVAAAVGGKVVEGFRPEEAYVNIVAWYMSLCYLKRKKFSLFDVIHQSKGIPVWDPENSTVRYVERVVAPSGDVITPESIISDFVSGLPYVGPMAKPGSNDIAVRIALMLPGPFVDPKSLRSGDLSGDPAAVSDCADLDVAADFVKKGMLKTLFVVKTGMRCSPDPASSTSFYVLLRDRWVKFSTAHNISSGLFAIEDHGRGCIRDLSTWRGDPLERQHGRYIFPSVRLPRALREEEIEEAARRILDLRSPDGGRRAAAAYRLSELSSGRVPLRLQLEFELKRKESSGAGDSTWTVDRVNRTGYWAISGAPGEGDDIYKDGHTFVNDVLVNADKRSGEKSKSLEVVTESAILSVAPLYKRLHQSLLRLHPFLVTLPRGSHPRVFVHSVALVPAGSDDLVSLEHTVVIRWIDLGPIDLTDKRAASWLLRACSRLPEVLMEKEIEHGHDIVIGYPVAFFPYRNYRNYFDSINRSDLPPVRKVSCNLGVAGVLYHASSAGLEPPKARMEITTADNLILSIGTDVPEQGLGVRPLPVPKSQWELVSEYSLGRAPQIEDFGPALSLRKDARQAMLRALKDARASWDAARLRILRAFSASR